MVPSNKEGGHMENLFSGSEIKIRRANKLLIELEASILEYFQSKPVACTTKKSENNGAQCIIFEMSIEKPVPEEISAIVGDIIHNLRSALDLMACDLVRAAGNSEKKVYFPFCENENYLDDQIKVKNFDRAGPKAIHALKEIKPYNGGNPNLRAIHDLDIQDKHQTLIPNVMSFATPVIRRWDDDGTPNLTVVGDSDTPSMVALAFPKGSPLESQDIAAALRNLVELTENTVKAFRATISG